MFSLLVFAFFVLIILAHSWGFWRVYRIPIDQPREQQVFIRGAAAGFAGWFWLCFGLGVWNWNNTGTWMLIIWIYGLLLVPAIGLAFTLIFWWVFKKLPVRLGILSRMLSGCAAGVVLGLIIGFYLTANSAAGRNFIHPMTLVLGAMGIAAGIMAGESEINE